MRALRPVLLLLALAGCATPRAASEAPPVLTVAALADFHGRLEPHLWHTAGGETVEVGGAALLGGYLAILRDAAEGPVLLVDAGDMWQGTLASNLAEGAPVVRLYDHLGVAAAAVGNHEFDFGPEGPAPIPQGPGDDPRGALKARAAEARFPLLAANLRTADGGRPPWVRPSILLELDGLRVGVVGVASEDTPSTTAGLNLVGLTFTPAAPAVREAARALRDEGAEVVVVLFHGGTDCGPRPGEGLAGCAPGALVDLVTGLPPGLVDLVVGGHTHGTAARSGAVGVLQAGSQGRALGLAWVQPGVGTLRAAVVPLCGRVAGGSGSCDPGALTAADRTEAATFLGRSVVPDPATAAVVAPALAAARQRQASRVGVALEAPLGADRRHPAALGVLVAEVLRQSVPDADVGVMNSGGVRASLPSGPLTRGRLFEALPFDNRPAVLLIDGATLRRMVALGLGPGADRLQWAGLTWRLGEDCAPVDLAVHGHPLDDAATYRVVTNDFLARGGSGFDGLGLPPAAVRVREDLPWLRDLVAEALADPEGADRVAHARREAAAAVERESACVVESRR